MKNRYWIKGTEENGEPWDGYLLFENKESAIKYAKFQNEIKKFKELRVESIFDLKPVWRIQNETETK